MRLYDTATSTIHRNVAIEALRGCAALSVAVVHSLGAAAALGVASPVLQSLPWLAGVDVFFVVSGFVMVHASRDRFGVPGARRRFAAHRIARIVPLYWIVTTAFVALALARPTAFTDPLDGWRTVLVSYLFVPWPRHDGSLLPVFRLGWTLEYEALFYAIFTIAIGVRRTIALTTIFAALAGLVVLGLDWPAAPPQIRFWSDPIILEFGFGMALAIAHDTGVRLPPAAAPVLVAGGLGLLAWAGNIPTPWSRPFAYGIPAAMLVALALLQPRPGLAPYLRRLALQAGAVSYALYLTHLFAIRGTREMFRVVPLSNILLVPTALVVSIALAALTHRFIERPAVAAFRRALARAMPTP